MAVLCSPRWIRSSDRGKGAVLNAAFARLFVVSVGVRMHVPDWPRYFVCLDGYLGT